MPLLISWPGMLDSHPNFFVIWCQAESSVSLFTDPVGWDQFRHQKWQGLRILKSQGSRISTLHIPFIMVHYNLLPSSKTQPWISKQIINLLTTNHNGKFPPLLLTSSLTMPYVSWSCSGFPSETSALMILCTHHSPFWWFLCLLFLSVQIYYLGFIYHLYKIPPHLKNSLSLIHSSLLGVS